MLKKLIALTVLVTIGGSIAIFVLGENTYKELALALMLALLGSVCLYMAIRGVITGSTPASLGGALQFSRAQNPTAFSFNCWGYGAMGLLALASALHIFVGVF